GPHTRPPALRPRPLPAGGRVPRRAAWRGRAAPLRPAGGAGPRVARPQRGGDVPGGRQRLGEVDPRRGARRGGRLRGRRRPARPRPLRPRRVRDPLGRARRRARARAGPVQAAGGLLPAGGELLRRRGADRRQGARGRLRRREAPRAVARRVLPRARGEPLRRRRVVRARRAGGRPLGHERARLPRGHALRGERRLAVPGRHPLPHPARLSRCPDLRGGARRRRGDRLRGRRGGAAHARLHRGAGAVPAAPAL
ncbi:MAG: ABC transporter, ATP-binding protein, partial [uncultured Solirubrobacteraceae bacterium]